MAGFRVRRRRRWRDRVNDAVWRWCLLLAWSLQRYPSRYRPSVLQVLPPEPDDDGLVMPGSKANGGPLIWITNDCPDPTEPVRVQMLRLLFAWLRRRHDHRLRDWGKPRSDAEMFAILAIPFPTSPDVTS